MIMCAMVSLRHLPVDVRVAVFGSAYAMYSPEYAPPLTATIIYCLPSLISVIRDPPCAAAPARRTAAAFSAATGGWRWRRSSRSANGSAALRRVGCEPFTAAQNRAKLLARRAHHVVKIRELLRRRDETERRETRVARVR